MQVMEIFGVKCSVLNDEYISDYLRRVKIENKTYVVPTEEIYFLRADRNPFANDSQAFVHVGHIHSLRGNHSRLSISGEQKSIIIRVKNSEVLYRKASLEKMTAEELS